MTHARDDVADGRVSCDLSLLLIEHRIFGGSSACGQQLVYVGEEGFRGRTSISQAVNELNQKCIGQLRTLELRFNRRRWLGTAPIDAQRTVRQLVGFAAFVPTIDDAVGDAPEVFNQNKSECDCGRPEFADRKILYFLVGPQEAAPRIDVETAVSVRHVRPCDFEHSRVARERPISKFGQLPIIASRQICANFTDLTLHLVEIVDQPFRCWGDGSSNGDRAADRLIGKEEASFVVCQSIQKWTTFLPMRPDDLGPRQTLCMALQTLDAEDRLPNNVRIVPRRFRHHASEHT